MTFPPSPSRRTLRAFAFITVWPIVTWPSPATTTRPFLRTERMVVPCHALSIECSDVMIRVMWDFTNADKDIGAGVSDKGHAGGFAKLVPSPVIPAQAGIQNPNAEVA